MDEQFLMKFIKITNENKYLGNIFYLCFKISTKLFLIVYSLTLIFLTYSKSNRIYYFVALPLTCYLTNLLLRKIFKKDRPHNKCNITTPYLIKKKSSYSFPSNHAASSMVIALSFMYINKYIGILLFLLSILTGLSRAFLGIHFFSDVLAGWTVGIIFAVVGILLI